VGNRKENRTGSHSRGMGGRTSRPRDVQYLHILFKIESFCWTWSQVTEGEIRERATVWEIREAIRRADLGQEGVHSKTHALVAYQNISDILEYSRTQIICKQGGPSGSRTLALHLFPPFKGSAQSI